MSLKNLELINPIHLTLSSDGHGEFPDGYKLTEEGIKYIKENMLENIKGELELTEEPKEYSAEVIIASVKQLIKEL